MPVREVRWEDRRDPVQEAALERARRQAAAARIPFRVVDVRRLNPFRRILLARALRAREFPIILWKGPCVSARADEAADPRPSSPEAL
jgi:hypothetical protein